jgi:hypothetical protein
VVYNFPADGEYNFRSLLHTTSVGTLFGNVPNEQLEVSVNGERVALLTVDLTMTEALPTGMNLYSGRVFVKAGPHSVASAFIQKHTEMVEDDIGEIEHSNANSDIGSDKELTTHPASAGIRDQRSVQRVRRVGYTVAAQGFYVSPAESSGRTPCATKIVSDLARKAYRRPITADDMEGLMTFYDQGRKKADFETGIRSAVQAMLTSLDFVFKFERAPATVKAGQTYKISDLELASRLSYFLWNTILTRNSSRSRARVS